jgi:hypothetical protein
MKSPREVIEFPIGRKTEASKFRVNAQAEETVTYLQVAARRQLMSQLKGTVQLLNEKEEQEARRLDCERAKAVITHQLAKIRENSSPDAAIQFLEETLAAVKG